MNKQMLLEWLLQDAETHEKDFLRKTSVWEDPRESLLDDLFDLNGFRDVDLPDPLPSQPNKLLDVLRNSLNDNVTLISRVLGECYPDRYIYYNVSKLENEIFDGLIFFSDLVPEFRLPFDRIGKRGVERYLQLNQVLFDFAHHHWPKQKSINGRIMYFLYNGLGRLFLTREDIQRYWIFVCGEQDFAELDNEDKTTWTARKEMRPGDLIFVYRTSPRKAITDLFRATDEPFFDPYWGWKGFKIKMERVCQIPEIPFGKMWLDPVLKEWGLIRRHFQGTIAEPISNRVYNRLLEFIPAETRKKNQLEPEAITDTGSSGTFGSEVEFEEMAIIPLLKKLGLKYEYQYTCPFHVGTQVIRGRVDFLVNNDRGPLTLFEDKLRIRTDRNEDLEPAALQARSYALLLGLPSFVVAAPEGLWIYRLKNSKHELEKHFSPEALATDFEDVRVILERIRN